MSITPSPSLPSATKHWTTLGEHPKVFVAVSGKSILIATNSRYAWINGSTAGDRANIAEILSRIRKTPIPIISTSRVAIGLANATSAMALRSPTLCGPIMDTPLPQTCLVEDMSRVIVRCFVANLNLSSRNTIKSKTIFEILGNSVYFT
jgi:hypothetical protein